MNKSTKRDTTRRRREKRKKSNFLVHALIAVVALIECFMLVTFTSYSWIETSSSLIISTGGNKGMEASMAVARNLSYQVLVSPDAGGAVQLAAKNTNGMTEDDGFFRKVEGFNFARTSSPNGKDFYFKSNGGSTLYRQGDTTDYNINYTYLDFEVKNTTGYVKEFCFRDLGNMLVYNGDSAYEDTILDAIRISFELDPGSDSADQNSIDNNPLIVSRNPATYNPVCNTSGTSTSAITFNDNSGTTYHSIAHHYYVNPTTETPNPTQYPIFTSDAESNGGTAVDRVSVRIWFEEKDAGYAALNASQKAACDAALQAAKITVNFALVSDTIDYDAIYFDDYAFSNRVGCEGKFVTDEKDDYSMYLHAHTSKAGESEIGVDANGFKNFKMTKTVTNETPANRWVVSVPLDYVVDHNGAPNNYLTKSGNTDPLYWNNTYFYYGNADGTERLYQWDFSSLPDNQYLEVEPDPNSATTGYLNHLTDRCSYFRNLGVVRDRTNYNSDEAEAGKPVVRGFLQYDRYTGSDPMQLTYLRDEATALTNTSYNTSSGDVLNYRYISTQAQKIYGIMKETETQTPSGGGSGTVSFDYTELIRIMTRGAGSTVNDLTANQRADLDRISYFDVPSGWYVQFISYGNNDNKTADKLIRATGQTCYYVASLNNNSSIQSNVQEGPNLGYGDPNNQSQYPDLVLNSSVLPASTSTDGWVRIYFYKGVGLDGNGQYQWGNSHRVRIKLYSYYEGNQAWYDERNGGVTITSGNTPSDGTEGISLLDAMTNGTTSYTDKNGSSGSGTTTVITVTTDYQRYYGGLYLNLHGDQDYEDDVQKTVSTYYDSSAMRFMAYVPQSWRTGGFDVHYNELSGYYDLDLDKLRWSTGASGDSDTYSLLGYTDAHTVAELNTVGVNVGSGVGTWDTVRRIEYSGELLYTGSDDDTVYKAGTTANTYAMVPVADDELYYTYFAYVPVSNLENQSSNHELRFERYVDYDETTVSGVWYPQENITERDKTYYAVDAAAAVSGAVSANRGWFHVAVFVDGTFENIVYDTLYGQDTVTGAKLEFAEESGSSGSLTYHPVVTATGSDNPTLGTNVAAIGSSRWVVPLDKNTNYVHFRWTPYPERTTSGSTIPKTEFNYTLDLANGIYCVVSEANSH